MGGEGPSRAAARFPPEGPLPACRAQPSAGSCAHGGGRAYRRLRVSAVDRAGVPLRYASGLIRPVPYGTGAAGVGPPPVPGRRVVAQQPLRSPERPWPPGTPGFGCAPGCLATGGAPRGSVSVALPVPALTRSVAGRGGWQFRGASWSVGNHAAPQYWGARPKSESPEAGSRTLGGLRLPQQPPFPGTILTAGCPCLWVRHRSPSNALGTQKVRGRRAAGTGQGEASGPSPPTGRGGDVTGRRGVSRGSRDTPGRHLWCRHRWGRAAESDEGGVTPGRAGGVRCGSPGGLGAC
jgi:hypothetical protein